MEVLEGDKWSVLNVKIPVPIYDCGVYSLNETILICGGVSITGGITNACYLFD